MTLGEMEKTFCSPPSQHSSLRQQLTHLREENSQLATQSNRLISELEDTSHQLLAANSKVGVVYVM